LGFSFEAKYTELGNVEKHEDSRDDEAGREQGRDPADQ